MGRLNRTQEKMPKATLGFRAHSGWSAMVVIAGSASSPIVIDRKRIELKDSSIPGPAQPYHEAEGMQISKATQHIKRWTEKTDLLALQAIQTVVTNVSEQGYRIVGCGIIQSSAKDLPVLEKILASHPMIHTAEGVFFRDAIVKASELCDLSVTKVREREAYDVAASRFGLSVDDLQRRINELGRMLGPPWRQDEKLSTIVGLLALATQTDSVKHR